MKRSSRLQVAEEWSKNYTGTKIVKGYSKWFGVDLICAITELRLVGVEVSEEYEAKVREYIADNAAEVAVKQTLDNAMLEIIQEQAKARGYNK